MGVHSSPCFCTCSGYDSSDVSLTSLRVHRFSLSQKDPAVICYRRLTFAMYPSATSTQNQYSNCFLPWLFAFSTRNSRNRGHKPARGFQPVDIPLAAAQMSRNFFMCAFMPLSNYMLFLQVQQHPLIDVLHDWSDSSLYVVERRPQNSVQSHLYYCDNFFIKTFLIAELAFWVITSCWLMLNFPIWPFPNWRGSSIRMGTATPACVGMRPPSKLLPGRYWYVVIALFLVLSNNGSWELRRTVSELIMSDTTPGANL